MRKYAVLALLVVFGLAPASIVLADNSPYPLPPKITDNSPYPLPPK